MGYTVYGCGVGVLGYIPVGGGHYRVMLWVTLFFIPIFPLACRVVRPAGVRWNVMGDKFGFEVIRHERLRVADIVRVYAIGCGLTVVAFAPLVALVVYAQNNWTGRD